MLASSFVGERVMKALEDVQRKVHEPNVEGTKEALRRVNANAPDLIAEAEGKKKKH